MDKRNRQAIDKILRQSERYYRAWLKEWAAQIGRAALSPDTQEAEQEAVSIIEEES